MERNPSSSPSSQNTQAASAPPDAQRGWGAPSDAHASQIPRPPLDPRRTSLYQQIKQVEPMTDRLLRWLPEWVRDIVQDRRKNLLYLERKAQRRLINEFRAQARELDPVLRSRGRMVGETIVDVFTSQSSSGTDMTYAQVVASSLPNTVADKLPKELVTVIDPLITPFLDPFVEGIKVPINEKAAEIKTTVVSSFAATGAACLVAGFLLGRYLPGGGGGGGSSGSGGGRQ